MNESLGEDRAAGGMFQLLGSWTAFGSDSGSSGTAVLKLESHHTLGTELTPDSLGFEAGAVSNTAAQFGGHGWALTNLYWQQRFSGTRLSVIVGQVDPADYVDTYGLGDPETTFQNQSFSTGPTIALPSPGLGLALGGGLTENVYFVAGLSDANGNPTRLAFSSFFEKGEYFKHVELGWFSSFDRRFLDNVHLTFWHQDEREAAQRPSGWGLAFSAAFFTRDEWLPFLRVGRSRGDTALLESSVSSGIGRYGKRRKELLGFGVSWGQPPGQGRDQWTSELFYRLQLTRSFAVTLDLQLIVHPALNPDADTVWLFGIRARLAL